MTVVEIIIDRNIQEKSNWYTGKSVILLESLQNLHEREKEGNKKQGHKIGGSKGRINCAAHAVDTPLSRKISEKTRRKRETRATDQIPSRGLARMAQE